MLFCRRVGAGKKLNFVFHQKAKLVRKKNPFADIYTINKRYVCMGMYKHAHRHAQTCMNMYIKACLHTTHTHTLIQTHTAIFIGFPLSGDAIKLLSQALSLPPPQSALSLSLDLPLSFFISLSLYFALFWLWLRRWRRRRRQTFANVSRRV